MWASIVFGSSSRYLQTTTNKRLILPSYLESAPLPINFAQPPQENELKLALRYRRSHTAHLLGMRAAAPDAPREEGDDKKC